MAKYGVKHKTELAYHLRLKGIMTINHQALLAIKNMNFDFQAVGEKRLFQINELEEIRNDSYENA